MNIRKKLFHVVFAVAISLLVCGRGAVSAPTCSTCDERSQRILNDLDFFLSGPRDCTDVGADGRTASGIYKIFANGRPRYVYCDLKTPNGGWLVFQRRMNGKENFHRTWVEYQRGFGNLKEEFWLGNEILHKLTTERKYKLRIDLMDFTGNKRYAEYSTFSVGSSASGYKLTVGGYTGDAGDSFSYHNDMKFTTKDRDLDVWDKNCAVTFRGAWWYKSCHYSNLNGFYLHGKHTSYADGVIWNHWMGNHYSLKITEMKIALAN